MRPVSNRIVSVPQPGSWLLVIASVVAIWAVTAVAQRQARKLPVQPDQVMPTPEPQQDQRTLPRDGRLVCQALQVLGVQPMPQECSSAKAMLDDDRQGRSIYAALVQKLRLVLAERQRVEAARLAASEADKALQQAERDERRASPRSLGSED